MELDSNRLVKEHYLAKSLIVAARSISALAVFATALWLSACGGSTDAQTPTPGVAVGSASVKPTLSVTGSITPSASPTTFVYTVKDGDVLGAVADQFGISVDSLMEANGIADPTSLHVGQALSIPGITATPAPGRTPISSDSPIGMVLSMPIAGACLTTDDTQMPNAPREYRSGVHEGVDFFTSYACVEIPKGTQVLASADGTIIRADHDYRELSQKQIDDLVARSVAQGYTDEGALDQFRGRQVWIDHGGGIVTRYCHLAAIPPEIQDGTRVSQGQIIGYTGDSGTPNSASNPDFDIHLHFEVRVGKTYLGKGLDPLATRNLYERVFGLLLTTPTPEP